MENKEIAPLKLRIQYEVAIEIIFISIVIILIGLAYLFASNLLRFNWFTVSFALIALIIILLRFNSYIIIKEDILEIKILHFFTYKRYEMKTIDRMIFYENNKKVEVQSNESTIVEIYLAEKNRFKLLDWLVNYYPNIDCLYL